MQYTNPDFGSFRLGESMAAGQDLAANRFRLDEQQRAVQSRASIEQGLRTNDMSLAQQQFPIETQKFQQGQESINLDLQAKKLAAAHSQISFLGQLASGVTDEPSYQAALSQAKAANIPVTNAPANYDPNWIKQTQDQVFSAKDRVELQMKNLQMQMEMQKLNETKRMNDASISEKQSLADLHKKQAALLVNNGEGGIGSFTEGSIEDAANRYLITGTLPPNLGRGAQGSAVTGKVVSKANQIAKDSGLSSEEVALAQVQNKSGLAALTQISKQEATVGSFEKNFSRNADLLLEQSAKTDRTGVPVVNRWLLAGKKSIAGDPEVSKLDLAVKTVVNEYTKILSGSMGNTQMAEGEIKKVSGLLSAAQTPEQIEAVVGFMRRETANRIQGFKDQKSQIVNGMKIGKQNSIAPQATTAQGQIPLQNAKGWTLHKDAKGNKAYVGPNGEIEEVQ